MKRPLPHPATEADRSPPPVEIRSVLLLLAEELRAAWRNHWFVLYAVVFGVLALGTSWLSLGGMSGGSLVGLGRTTASLVNLVVLVVPLMGLTLGATALAGERENGTLLYLMAQPVSRSEVVLGKFLGLATAVVAALVLGFGAAALIIARQADAGDVREFLLFLGLSVLVATSSVALGLMISAWVDRASVATGVGLFTWLALVLLGDLGLLGTSLVLKLSAPQLLWSALVNPLQQFKIAAVQGLRGGLEVLGPAGLYADRAWGGSLLPLLVGGLVLWTVVPLGLTFLALRRRGAL